MGTGSLENRAVQAVPVFPKQLDITLFGTLDNVAQDVSHCSHAYGKHSTTPRDAAIESVAAGGQNGRAAGARPGDRPNCSGGAASRAPRAARLRGSAPGDPW